MLTIVRGAPGTGKSTFVRNKLPGILHLENDMYHYHNGEYVFSQNFQDRAITWCSDMAIIAMKKGMDLCVSNTFTKRIYVDYYVNAARRFGYDVTVYRMMGEFDNIHNVPQNILDNMKNNFDSYPGELFVYPSDNGSYDIREVMK